MTLPMAAERYGRNAEYLRVAANRGALKAEKIGRDWLVTDAEMVRYTTETTRGRPKKKEDK